MGTFQHGGFPVEPTGSARTNSGPKSLRIKREAKKEAGRAQGKWQMRRKEGRERRDREGRTEGREG